jgi:hypothetical protein
MKLGLITNRERPQLVPDWQEHWERLAELKGTAGKKQAAVEALRDNRKRRERFRLVRRGKAAWIENGVVVMNETGEIV